MGMELGFGSVSMLTDPDGADGADDANARLSWPAVLASGTLKFLILVLVAASLSLSRSFFSWCRCDCACGVCESFVRASARAAAAVVSTLGGRMCTAPTAPWWLQRERLKGEWPSMWGSVVGRSAPATTSPRLEGRSCLRDVLADAANRGGCLVSLLPVSCHSYALPWDGLVGACLRSSTSVFLSLA